MSERVEVLEIDLTDIREEAQNTGKTLKDLRAEVKNLRAQLEQTEIGSDGFGKTLDDLTRKQQELTNVTKSGVAAQKGSYNDLVNQMALLKKEWRATADEGKRAALGEQINEINTKLKELDASTGNYQRNVGNYRQELKQLKEQLLELEEGTEEYNTALARASEISQKMQDVNEFVSNSAQDLGDHMANVTGAAAGMVGAFQTVQATLNLIGVESENVGKMLATMQNLMAITQGLKAVEGAIDPIKRLGVAIKGTTLYQKLFGVETNAVTVAQNANTVATNTATVATNAFKKALIATGIGAIIVLIGTLIAYWEDLKEALGFAKEEQEEVNEAMEESIEREKERKRVVNESVGSIIGKYKLLQAQWKELSSVEEKNDWIRKNRDAFNDLGLSINDVNAAQSVFITNSEAVIKAIKDQARARAMAKLYEEAIAQQYTAQQELEDAKATAKSKYYSGYKPSDDEAKKAGLTTSDYGTRLEEQSLWDQLWNDEGTYKTVATDWVDYGGARKLQDEYTRPFQQSVAAINSEVAKLEEAFIEAEKTAADSAAAVQELGINYTPTSGGSSGGSSGGTTKEETPEEKAKRIETSLRKIYEERLKVERELDQHNFDALQTQRADQFVRELAELDREQAEELAKLNEYYRTVLEIDQETGEWRAVVKEEADIKEGDRRLLTTEEYNKAQLDIEKIYAEKIKKVADEKAEYLDAQAKKRLDDINDEYDKAIQRATREYDIESAVNSFTGNALAEARSLQTLLSAENEALVTQRDQLLALKEEMVAAGEDVEAIDLAIAENAANITMNSQKMTEAIASEKAAQLENVLYMFDAVSEAMDGLMGLDLGVAWSKEFNIAFSAFQSGISQMSDSLKRGEKGWQSYATMAATALNATASILSSLAEKEDETTEEGFEKQKKLQIASATMSMLAGIISSWVSAMSLPAPASFILGGVMSAATAAMGAIQIDAIKKQKLDGGGSGNVATPSFNALSMMDTGVQTTTTIEGASVEGTTTDTRVYVVESDITKTQNDVKTAVSEATY